jgi:hypothetical protein
LLPRIRRRIAALKAASCHRFYQFALLARIRPAIGKVDVNTVLVAVVVLTVLAVAIVAVVILAAVFSDKPTHRHAALAVRWTRFSGGGRDVRPAPHPGP